MIQDLLSISPPLSPQFHPYQSMKFESSLRQGDNSNRRSDCLESSARSSSAEALLAVTIKSIVTSLRDPSVAKSTERSARGIVWERNQRR